MISKNGSENSTANWYAKQKLHELDKMWMK